MCQRIEWPTQYNNTFDRTARKRMQGSKLFMKVKKRVDVVQRVGPTASTDSKNCRNMGDRSSCGSDANKCVKSANFV